EALLLIVADGLRREPVPARQLDRPVCRLGLKVSRCHDARIRTQVSTVASKIRLNRMMSELHRLTNPTIELLALGEPAHRELSFGAARNLIFERLVELGFRSIAVESDRVAAIMVDDYVRAGVGTLDRVLAEGFSHEFGAHPANRSLVAWMRSHNERQPPERRLAWYGFDAPMETLSAP